VLFRSENNFTPGGVMFRPNKYKSIQKELKEYTNLSIPPFIAANLENGGNGIFTEGTYYGTPMEIAATKDIKNAYQFGEICSLEGKMLAVNMSFAPVGDINFNFRNPITNTRSFGDNPEIVSSFSNAYIEAAHKQNMITTLKHFPGDGVDYRDHHLTISSNNLLFEDWNKSYGLVYQKAIDIGVKSIMVGHISLPNYFPDENPNKLVPASQNHALIMDLLRGNLNYNGLIITDASLMVGFMANGTRKDVLVRAINSGCDMILFNRSILEDYTLLLEAYHEALIPLSRINDAVARILATKASINLHDYKFEFKDIDYAILFNHKNLALELSKKAMTLVKDESNILPLKTEIYRKIGIIYHRSSSIIENVLSSENSFKNYMLKKILIKKETYLNKFLSTLNNRGFKTEVVEVKGLKDLLNIMKTPYNEFQNKYDLMIILTNISPQSNQSNLMIKDNSSGFYAPWFAKMIPTIHISLGNPYQFYEFEMISTVINAYSAKIDSIDILVDCLMDKTLFKGISPVNLNI